MTEAAAREAGPAATEPPRLPDALGIRPPRGGRIHPWRRAVQGVVSLLFLTAPFLDLLRFDLEGGRLVLLRSSFRLAELGPVGLVLVLSMLVVLGGAVLYGRLFCGWLCPQTTLSELSATLERIVVRGRAASRWRRIAARGAVSLLAAVVAASLVSYFLDPKDHLDPPPAARIAFLVLTAILAVDLLAIRHRFCAGVCPYGILQSIVQDRRTLGISLSHDLTKICLQCHSCIRSCFMGIDIRVAPFHPHCINCGDCIDAINLSHAKIDRPQVTGFRYGSAPPSRWPGVLRAIGIHDGRRAAIVSGILLLTGALAFTLADRDPLAGRLTPLFDRVEDDGSGTIRNHYRLVITNRTEEPFALGLAAGGLPGIRVERPEGVLLVPAGESLRFDLLLAAPRGEQATGAHPISVTTSGAKGRHHLDLRTRFFIPSPK